MSNIFKPGDRVAILYPYPADNPKPHNFFKHGEPLVVVGVFSKGKVVTCKREGETEDIAYTVNEDRLNFFYGVVEKEACKVNEDVPACTLVENEYLPFDLVKYNHGGYDLYYHNGIGVIAKVSKVIPVDDRYVVIVAGVHTLAVKEELGLKPIERKFYANVYPEGFGKPSETIYIAGLATLPASLGIVEVTYSNGKLISVNIVK